MISLFILHSRLSDELQGSGFGLFKVHDSRGRCRCSDWWVGEMHSPGVLRLPLCDTQSLEDRWISSLEV